MAPARPEVTQHRFVATSSSGEVSAVLLRPRASRALYVFAHGAGAGMRHAFMEAVAARLAFEGVASFRFNFPFTETGKRGPNPEAVLLKTARSAVAEARRLEPELPLFAGGKSMGGRMISKAAAAEALAGVIGIAFFGFPLHAPGKASDERGAHLADVGLPMLFLQGARDDLADLSLLEPLLARVRPRPTLHVVPEANHGFHVPKRTGRTDDDVLAELCSTFASWADGVISGS